MIGKYFAEIVGKGIICWKERKRDRILITMENSDLCKKREVDDKITKKEVKRKEGVSR